MRTIKFDTPISRTQFFANNFIDEKHRVTKKVKNHLLMFTFNSGTVDWEKHKDVDFIIDLLYQAFVIKNDVDKEVICIDKKQKESLVINIW